MASSLVAALAQIKANIAAMTLNPRPNYSLEGQSYSWADLYGMYTNQMLLLEQAIQREDGPFEVRSVGI